MIIYKRIVTKNNRVQYWKDNKMVKQIMIPDAILRKLEVESVVEVDMHSTTDEVVEVNTKVCLFDEEPATNHKFINGITIGLCRDHYLTKTSGQIVQKINEKEPNT